MSQVHPPLTALSGAFSPNESLHAIGRSLEFLSSAIFSMWTHCDEELKDQSEGLQYLLAHLATLQLHASQLCEEQIKNLSKNNEILEQQLCEYQQLCSLYQKQLHGEQLDQGAQQSPDVAAKVAAQVAIVAE